MGAKHFQPHTIWQWGKLCTLHLPSPALIPLTHRGLTLLLLLAVLLEVPRSTHKNPCGPDASKEASKFGTPVIQLSTGHQSVLFTEIPELALNKLPSAPAAAKPQWKGPGSGPTYLDSPQQGLLTQAKCHTKAYMCSQYLSSPRFLCNGLALFFVDIPLKATFCIQLHCQSL